MSVKKVKKKGPKKGRIDEMMIDTEIAKKIANLRLAIELSKRYVEAASEYVLEITTNDSAVRYSINGASVKRLSMDLTRTLAQTRKPVSRK